MIEQPLPFSSRYDPDDPCASRHKGSEESEDAWSNAKEHAAQSRRRVFRYIRACGEQGATVDEIAIAFGKTPNQISGRVSQLKATGDVMKKGERRMTRAGSMAAVVVAVR